MDVNNVQNIGFGGSNSGLSNSAQSEFSFLDIVADVVDIVNPLQHIPIVSDIYRAVTGDGIGAVANVVGGTIFGGPIGGAVALASEIADSVFGDDDASGGKLLESNFSRSSTHDISSAIRANDAYASSSNIRVTTADWLNPNFDKSA